MGSVVKAAALKYLAMGPAEVDMVYRIDYGAIQAIGKEVLAKLNLPISNDLPIYDMRPFSAVLNF